MPQRKTKSDVQLSIPIPESLHRKLRALAALSGQKLRYYVQGLLQAHADKTGLD